MKTIPFLVETGRNDSKRGKTLMVPVYICRFLPVVFGRDNAVGPKQGGAGCWDGAKRIAIYLAHVCHAIVTCTFLPGMVCSGRAGTGVAIYGTGTSSLEVAGSFSGKAPAAFASGRRRGGSRAPKPTDPGGLL